MVVKDWGKGVLGSDSLVGMGFTFGGQWKYSRIRQEQSLYNVVNILNITKLYTLKNRILCYINYVSILKYKRISPFAHGKLTPIALVSCCQ